MLVINQYAKTWSNWLSVSWLFKNLEKKLILSTRLWKKDTKNNRKIFLSGILSSINFTGRNAKPQHLHGQHNPRSQSQRKLISMKRSNELKSLNKGGKKIIWCYRPAITYEFSQYEWDTHKFQPVCPIWSVLQPTLYGPHKYACYSERTRPAEFKVRSIIESKHIVPIKLPVINFQIFQGIGFQIIRILRQLLGLLHRIFQPLISHYV